MTDITNSTTNNDTIRVTITAADAITFDGQPLPTGALEMPREVAVALYVRLRIAERGHGFEDAPTFTEERRAALTQSLHRRRLTLAGDTGRSAGQRFTDSFSPEPTHSDEGPVPA